MADETATFEFGTRVYINKHPGISQKFFSVNNNARALIRHINFAFIIQVYIFIYLCNISMYFGPTRECRGTPKTLPRNSSFFTTEKQGPC